MKYFLLISLFLTGCAYPRYTSSYSPQTVNKEKAHVYIYRTKTSIDSMNPDIPRFFVNDKLLGKLGIGGYYFTEVDPGEVDVAYYDSLFGIPMAFHKKHLKFKAESGQKYFVKFSIESVMRITEFKQVPQSQGEVEIESTVLLVN